MVQNLGFAIANLHHSNSLVPRFRHCHVTTLCIQLAFAWDGVQQGVRGHPFELPLRSFVQAELEQPRLLGTEPMLQA